MAPPDLLRLAIALVGLAAGAAAVALAALLLHRTPGPVQVGSSAPAAPQAPARSPAPPRTSSFPAPPSGAVVFSREDGPDALALAVVPRGSHVLAQASVVGQQGVGVNGLDVTFGATRAAACGAGCYRALLLRSKFVDLRVRGGGATTRWLVALPSPWPARDASALVTRAAHVWRSLRTLAFYDRLASDPVHAVVSTWRAVAPNRLAYSVQGGYDAVIIGGRRWDRAPHGRWVESSQSLPVTQPTPVWVSARDAHVVGESPSTWRITFYDPRTPAWFAITVDKRSLHTLDLRMTTTAHFMHERYGPFDAPIAVKPPTG
jgi:hypothetical protein